MVSLIPKTFFLLPIQVGADIISVVEIFNKASAFYALGALVTSHPLTVAEWVMNVISVVELPLIIWLTYRVFNRDALPSLAYAYLYALDAAMNLGFTIFFIVHWFVVGTKKAQENNPAARAVTELLSIRADKALNKSATVGQELAVTIVCTTFSLLVKLYFTLVIIGFARIVVQNANLRPYNGEPKGSKYARLQFALLRPFERFWTGHSTYQRLASYPNKPE